MRCQDDTCRQLEECKWGDVSISSTFCGEMYSPQSTKDEPESHFKTHENSDDYFDTSDEILTRLEKIDQRIDRLFESKTKGKQQPQVSKPQVVRNGRWKR